MCGFQNVSLITVIISIVWLLLIIAVILWPAQDSTADRSVSAQQQTLGDTITQETGPAQRSVLHCQTVPQGWGLTCLLLCFEKISCWAIWLQMKREKLVLCCCLWSLWILSYLKVQVKLNCVFFVSYSMGYISVISVITFHFSFFVKKREKKQKRWHNIEWPTLASLLLILFTWTHEHVLHLSSLNKWPNKYLQGTAIHLQVKAH